MTLSSSGYETHLVAPNAPNKNMGGIHLHSVSQSTQNRLLRMTSTVWKIYQKALEINADIYHFHDPELLVIGLLLKLQGKKVIYDVHEDVPRQILNKQYIPVSIRHFISVMTEAFENAAVRNLDGIITATPFLRDRFLSLGCHAIDVKNYPVLNSSYLAETNALNEEAYVCYIGSINEVRGIFQMVEAIAKTNARLLLGGKFDSLREKEKIMQLPGWQQVVELGFLDRKGVAQTLSKATAGLVLLHPIVNYIDALPVKMFEYMAAGIPVISSNIPYWQEIIEGSQCGICVDPMNPEAIAEAIEWIICHPIESRTMGENGRKAVEEKYNWKNESDILLAFYENLSEVD